MPPDAQSSLLSYWSRVLHEHGNRTAVIDFATDSRHSFAEIEAQAQRISNELSTAIAQGNILPGKAPAILLCLPNGAQWLAAYLAIHRCKAAIVPLEAEPNTIATAATLPVLSERLQTVARIDNNGISRISQTGSGEATVTHGAGQAAAEAIHLIKLTSGSTGQPQALCFSEANMIADGLNIIATMGLRADTLNYATIPFGHSYGLGNLVLPFLIQGTAIACASGILPRLIAREIAASNATFFPAVPTLIRALCVAQTDTAQLATLERIISAGSPLSPDVARDFYSQYGKRIHNFYGSSETGGICFDADGEATLSGRSIGTALKNVCVDIDEAGCVRVQSAAVCGDLVDAEQRISLPDYGTLLPDGSLCLNGRSGRQVKIGARRLDLNTWEAQVRTLAGIEDAFACTGMRPGGEAMLCAAIQTQLPAAELHARLHAYFPRWQLPARLLALTAFPQTVRGKTDTHALRTQLAQREN